MRFIKYVMYPQMVTEFLVKKKKNGLESGRTLGIVDSTGSTSGIRIKRLPAL